MRRCACISDGAALGKKFSTRIEKIEMDDIAKKKKQTKILAWILLIEKIQTNK